MNGQQAYEKFCAIKTHFATDTYDYFKYNGRVRNLGQYATRKDKWAFDKLARLGDVELRVVAAMINGGRWIGDVVGEQGQREYTELSSRLDGFTYLFEQEINKLSSLSYVLTVSDGSVPPLVGMILANEFSIYSAVGLDVVLDYIAYWDRKIDDQYIWPPIRRKITKLRPFVKINAGTLRSIVRQKISSDANLDRKERV